MRGDWRAWLDGLHHQMYHQGIDTQNAAKLVEGFRLLAEALEAVCASWGYGSDDELDTVEWLEERARLYSNATRKLDAVDDFLRGVGRE